MGPFVQHTAVMRQVVLLGILFVVAGCDKSGPNIAPVSGRVTLNGQPLVNADITFQPEGAGSPSSARTREDGSYELGYKRGVAGAPVGKHIVRIVVSSEVVRNPPKISAKFNTNSDLRAEVKSGKNNFDFDVSAEPK
jgi:hypothetical protein